MESLYELWGKRNPQWEKRYQDSILEVFSDYGKGVNKYQDARGKIFGAGYEMFILAFFIGLYYNQTKPLTDDKAKLKTLGQAIMYWGNIETRTGRSAYPRIRDYMFAALIARTDKMIEKMEQYANFGFDYIQEKLEDDPNHFFKDTAFLTVFQSFLNKKEEEVDSDSDDPEEL